MTEPQMKRLFEHYGYELAIAKHVSCGVDELRVGAGGWWRCGDVVYADCVMTLADGAVVFAGCMVGRGLSNNALRMAGRCVLLAGRCVVLVGRCVVLVALAGRCVVFAGCTMVLVCCVTLLSGCGLSSDEPVLVDGSVGILE